jgi:hypothetical protein
MRGTLVHEGRHAYDFAQTLSSLSNADMNPLDVFNPSLYELEVGSPQNGRDYMICIGKQEYLDEGLQLMILASAPTDHALSVTTASSSGLMKITDWPWAATWDTQQAR